VCSNLFEQDSRFGWLVQAHENAPAEAILFGSV
jgi:hypothetical protein